MKTINNFGTQLFQKVSTKENSDLFISPYSIQVALGMCAAGAKGDTSKAMAKLLGVPANEQNKVFGELIREVNGDGKREYELRTANALWMAKDYTPKPAYVNLLTETFASTLEQVDYEKAPDAAVQQINDWTDKNTNGKIPVIVTRDFVKEDTRLILTNAIYFKGEWVKAFEKKKTADETWTKGDSDRYLTKVMNRKGDYDYYEGEGYKALQLPYKGGDLAMLVILPDYMKPLNEDKLGELYEQSVSGLSYENQVSVKLPSFKISSTFKLKEHLKAMGAELAFSDDADFTGIGDERMKIDEVIHKSFVEVNEVGTEAAAATAVGMIRCASMMPRQEKQFHATHPFLFFIRNIKTDTVLFSGRLVSPEKVK